MAHEKKSLLLGMNFVTARNRLDRDLLFHFVTVMGYKCHRCGEEITRDTFSVDHIENWSQAENPIESFFDIKNIAFSHHNCNSKHTSKTRQEHGVVGYKDGCRCEVCKEAKVNSRAPYCKDKRRQQYLRYGT